MTLGFGHRLTKADTGKIFSRRVFHLSSGLTQGENPSLALEIFRLSIWAACNEQVKSEAGSELEYRSIHNTPIHGGACRPSSAFRALQNWCLKACPSQPQVCTTGWSTEFRQYSELLYLQDSTCSRGCRIPRAVGISHLF